MAITRAQVTSLADFAAWMQENAVPGIFKSVTYDSSTSTATATDADDNVVLEIVNASGGHFRAYRSDESYLEIGLNAFPSTSSAETRVIQIIGCNNGFIVDMQIATSSFYAIPFAFLISKTNNDKVAIVWPSEVNFTENQRYKNALQHVAYGDSTTMSTTTTFIPEAGQQTSLVPFSTNADVEEVSYTPNAYWIAMSANYSMGMGKFRMGGDTFISNGYWAIKDNQSV